MEFVPYRGDLMGLAVNENHRVFEWLNDYDAKVLFSMTRRGRALSCHFASNKGGLRHLREVLNCFCVFCFNDFAWCKMIMANITVPSVKRFIVKHCGFTIVFERKEKGEYLCARCRK
jgi:hypothetical protein